MLCRVLLERKEIEVCNCIVVIFSVHTLLSSIKVYRACQDKHARSAFQVHEVIAVCRVLLAFRAKRENR